MERKTTFIAKIWRSSKSYVITIPKNVAKLLDLKEKDEVIVTIEVRK